MPPSTSFRPHDLHNHRKSNSLVCPAISSKYVQVLCAEMFLFSTTLYYPLPDLLRGSLPDWNLKSETQNPNIEIQKFLPTSLPCSVHQQATPCYLPVAWSLDVQCCNNECYSIVKEDCNGNISFENTFRYALTHCIVSGYPSKGLLPPPIARISCCTSSSSSSKSEPAAKVSSSSCNLQVKLAFT